MTFTLCSFWLVETLAGWIERAREVFDQDFSHVGPTKVAWPIAQPE